MKKIFIIVGWLHIPKEIVYEVFNKKYGFCRCWFVSEEKYLKSRFTYANNNGKKIEAIFVGPVPHKTFAAGKYTSMVTQLCISGSKTPVYVCKNFARVLKFTKTSLRQAIFHHEEYLRESKKEKEEIMEFEVFTKTLFPELVSPP
ncbi:MAG: hypothetical protein WCL02_08145 [bacterium]